MGRRKSRAVFSRMLRRSHFEKEDLNGLSLVRNESKFRQRRDSGRGKEGYRGGGTVGLERTSVSTEEKGSGTFLSIFGCLFASVNVETIRRQF